MQIRGFFENIGNWSPSFLSASKTKENFMHKAIGCRVNVIYYSIIDAPLASVGEFKKGQKKIPRTDDWKIAWGHILWMPSLRRWPSRVCSPFWGYTWERENNKHGASIKVDDANQMATRFLLSSQQVSILFSSFRIFSNHQKLLLPSSPSTANVLQWIINGLKVFFYFWFFSPLAPVIVIFPTMIPFLSNKRPPKLSDGFFSLLLIKLMSYWIEQLAIIQKEINLGILSKAAFVHAFNSCVGRQVALVRCCQMGLFSTQQIHMLCANRGHVYFVVRYFLLRIFNNIISLSGR